MSHYDQLITLKSMSEQGAETEKYIKAQEALFNQLKDDVKNKRIKKGVSKRQISFRYGTPILCGSVENYANIKEYCLYRLPTTYFNTDRVFFYFNIKGKLDSWELIPASQPPAKAPH